MIEKIKIDWKEFDIEHIEREKARLNVVSGDCYGEIHFDENKIYLNNEFSDEQKQATLIHEVLHGIEKMYSINNLDEDRFTDLNIKTKEFFQSVGNGKQLIASAITAKGIQTEATSEFSVMANNIKNISSSGGRISDDDKLKIKRIYFN